MLSGIFFRKYISWISSWIFFLLKDSEKLSQCSLDYISVFFFHVIIRCVAKGSVVDIPPAFKGLDWSKLLICDGAVSAVSPTVIPPVVEEDIDLFNSTLRVDDVSVGFNDVCHDSKYMTLAMETATVLETTTSDTILTQRRLTTAGRC